MPTDGTRITGFVSDLSRRIRALRDKPAALVHLRAIDRCLMTLERGEPVDGSDLAVKLDDTLRDLIGFLEAEERAQDEAHERERDGMFAAPSIPRGSRITPADLEPLPWPDPDRRERTIANYMAPEQVRFGLPGDDLGTPIAVDSDAPVATYRPAIRVVADDGDGGADGKRGG